MIKRNKNNINGMVFHSTDSDFDYVQWLLSCSFPYLFFCLSFSPFLLLFCLWMFDCSFSSLVSEQWMKHIWGENDCIRTIWDFSVRFFLFYGSICSDQEFIMISWTEEWHMVKLKVIVTYSMHILRILNSHSMWMSASYLKKRLGHWDIHFLHCLALLREPALWHSYMNVILALVT